MAAASESGEDFSVGGGRVCAAEAASWPVCKTGGGGAKQEDEVIAKVRGGEEGGGAAPGGAWTSDICSRDELSRGGLSCFLSPPSPCRLPARLRPVVCCDSEGFAYLSGMN